MPLSHGIGRREKWLIIRANFPLFIFQPEADQPAARSGGSASGGDFCFDLRRRADSNRRIKVLQTSPLPLGYGANIIAECGLVIAELVMGTLASYPHAPQLETRILHSAIYILFRPKRRDPQNAQSSTFNPQSLIYNLPTIKSPLPGGSWWQRGKFIEEVIPAIIVLR